MQVLLLTWEYPPRVLTAEGRRAAVLARALTRAGHDVHILTRHAVGRPEVETVAGVRIHRVNECPPVTSATDFVSWGLQFNFGLLRVGAELCRRHHFDVMHAFGWQVAHAASALQALFELPLVAGLPRRESRRGDAATGQANRFLHQTEWWLTYVARRVVVPDEPTREEVRGTFSLPPGKLDVLALDAGPDPARTVLFAGGAVYRDDASTMLAAAPRLLAAHPGIRLALAGTGDAEPALRRRARRLRDRSRIRFRGWLAYGVPDTHTEAAVVVVPSIAEPYEGVAVEALAARVPLVLGATDEMRRLVAHEPHGRSVAPGDPGALAAAVDDLLQREPVAAAPAAGPDAFVDLYERAVAEDRAARHRETPRVPLRLVWDRSRAFGATAEG